MRIMEAGRALWRSAFGPVPELSPEELREFRRRHGEDQYLLLDVRQPGEYRRGHLPGALLIPLPELEGRLDELDRQKTTVAYCAIGGRSRAAAELMAGRGFGEVYSLKGGIKAWQGATAQGPPEQGEALFPQQAGPAGLLARAYALERAMAAFYREMAEAMPDREAAGMAGRLARVEQGHGERVRRLCEQAGPGPAERDIMEQADRDGALEGGLRPEDLPAEGLDREAVLSLAMMVEAQAMDLYMRLARGQDGPARETLLELARQEKDHLAGLGGLLEREPGG